MHSLHACVLEVNANPAPQNLQTTVAAVFCSWYFPSLHAAHRVDVDANDDPAAQKRQSDNWSWSVTIVPWFTKYRPEGQSVQLTEGSVFCAWYFAAAHVVHALEDVENCLPA